MTVGAEVQGGASTPIHSEPLSPTPGPYVLGAFLPGRRSGRR